MDKIRATVEVEVNPEMLAGLFWDMDAEEQARFFNYLAANTDAVDFDNQMHWMRPYLSPFSVAYIGIMRNATAEEK